MDSYIVRIYGGISARRHGLIGIVEEVGTGEKKAFTNLDELWRILKLIKDRPAGRKDSIFLINNRRIEKRNEVRKRKEAPCMLICGRKNVKAETINCSKRGVGIKIPDRIPLRVGDTIAFKMRNHNLKAHVRWAEHRDNPLMTLAGLELFGGKLDMRAMKESRVLRV